MTPAIKYGRKKTIFDPPVTQADRVKLLALAFVLGAVGCWIFWAAGQFLNGPGWGDLVVRIILDDLAFATALFAVALVAKAVTSARWHDRLFSWSSSKLHGSVVFVLVLFGTPVVLFLLLCPFLVLFGILK